MSPATPEIYTLSLHDALPIWSHRRVTPTAQPPRTSSLSTGVRRTEGWHRRPVTGSARCTTRRAATDRSEEHTSELQSRRDLVCRLLLEKKKETPKSACHSRHD